MTEGCTLCGLYEPHDCEVEKMRVMANAMNAAYAYAASLRRPVDEPLAYTDSIGIIGGVKGEHDEPQQQRDKDDRRS
jgi:hypothetical protein